MTDIRYTSSRPRHNAEEYKYYCTWILAEKNPPRVFFVVEGESDRETIEEIGRRFASPEMMRSVEIRVPENPGKLGVDEEVLGIQMVVGGRAPVQGVIDRDADELSKVENWHLIALTDYWDFESTLFIGSTGSKRLSVLGALEQYRESLIEDALRELPLVGAMRRLNENRRLNLKFRDSSSEFGASVIGNYLSSKIEEKSIIFSIDQMGLAEQLVKGSYRIDVHELLRSSKALLDGSDRRTFIHGKDLIGFFYSAWRVLEHEGIAGKPPKPGEYLRKFRNCFVGSIDEEELHGLEIGSLVLRLIN